MVGSILDWRFKIICFLGVVLFAIIGHFGQVGSLPTWITFPSWFIAVCFIAAFILPDAA